MSQRWNDARGLIVALTLTTLAHTLVAIAVYAPAVLAPVAQVEIGVAASSIGIFISIVFATAVFSAPFGGGSVVRHGPVRVSQYCLLWAAGGIALFATAVPLAIVCAAVAMGLGYGPVTPASSAILSSRTPGRLRNVIMSIRQSGVTLGGAIAGALLPWLSVHYGWRASAFIVAALCAALAVLLQTVREQYDSERTDTRHPEHGSLRLLLRVVFSHAELRQVAFTSFTYACAHSCFGSFLVVFLTERGGIGFVEAGAAYSAAMFGGVAGRLLWGALADYFDRARMLLGILGVTISLCAFTITQVSPQWPYAAVIFLCTVFGASAFGWNGIYIAEIARIAPGGNVALATGAAITFTFVGMVGGPLAFWLVLALTGSYTFAFTLVGTVALAGGLLYFRKHPAPPAAQEKAL